MCLDTHNEWSSENPINQEELPPLTELEAQQEWNLELKKKNERITRDIIEVIHELETYSENTLLINKLKKIVNYGLVKNNNTEIGSVKR